MHPFSGMTFRYSNFNPHKINLARLKGEATPEKRDDPHEVYIHNCLGCGIEGRFVTEPQEVVPFVERALCWTCWTRFGRRYWHHGIDGLGKLWTDGEHQLCATLHKVLISLEEEIKSYAK